MSEDGAKDLGYWMAEFDKVQREARGHGVRSVVVMLYDDQLDDAEDKGISYIGMGPITMLGAAEYLKSRVLANWDGTL